MAYRDQFWTKLASRKQTSSEQKNLGSLKPRAMVKRDLLFCSLGDGLTVSDRNVEINGSYEPVAHINKDREVIYYANVAREYRELIEKVARNLDPDKPKTEEKVFVDRPVDQNQNDVDLIYVSIHQSPIKPHHFTENNMTRRDLLFCSLGNGLTVVDKLHGKYGDYETMAHINKDREVTYFVNDLAQEYKKRIESVAKSTDPNVSQTQDDKVFTTRPDRPVEDEGFSPR